MGPKESTKSKDPSKMAIRTALQGELAANIYSVYVIKAGKKIIWEGKNLEKVWPEVRKDFPSEQLSIAWKTPPGFFIV
jgi:hypothetical protein